MLLKKGASDFYRCHEVYVTTENASQQAVTYQTNLATKL